MGIFSKIGFRKAEEKVVQEELVPKVPYDEALIKELEGLVYLNPITALSLDTKRLSDEVYLQKVRDGIVEAAKKATEEKNKPNALVGYQNLAVFAIYVRDVRLVKEALDNYATLSGRLKFERIRENPEEAVRVAQQRFYRRG